MNPRTRLKRLPVFVLWTAAVLLMAGCSSEINPRQAIEGSVRVGGTDGGDGTLSFVPAEGNSGPAATAIVHDGHYRLDETRGPYAGPHRVTYTPHEPSQVDGNDASVNPKQSHAPSRYETPDVKTVTDTPAILQQQINVASGTIDLDF